MISDPLLGKLFDLYNFGLYPSLYCWSRCRSSPFQEMEKHIPREGLIYDFGCGEGVFANFLSLKSADREVIGIELLNRKFQVAKLSGERNTERIKFINVDVTNKEFVLSNCNGVILSDFLHHIHYDAQQFLLRKIFRCLNPDGTLLIRDVDKNYFSWRFWGNFILEFILYPFQKYYFRSSKELLSQLTKIGFKVKYVLAKEGLPFSSSLYICKK